MVARATLTGNCCPRVRALTCSCKHHGRSAALPRINPSAEDDADDGLQRLVTAVSDEARVLLGAVAQAPDTRMNLDKLTEVSGVRNVGAALQSLKIQRTRLDVAPPIEKRRDGKQGGRYVYWMSAPTAAHVLRIMEGDPLEPSRSTLYTTTKEAT